LKTTDEAQVLASDKVESVRKSHSHEASAKSHDSTSLVPDTCQCAETDFCHWEDEEWSPESLWVDLIDNPERFTGYSGPSAHKVWRSIYEENCFGLARPSASAGQLLANGAIRGSGLNAKSHESARQSAEALSSLLQKQSTPFGTADPTSEQCLEKRVFYRIISGLHASISIHICHEYLDQKTGEWQPNLQCFVERIAQHPERLQNVYFTYVVLTRAMAKLAERLGMTPTKDGRRSTGEVDQLLAQLAPGLPPSPTNGSLGTLLQQSLDSPPSFDEASMFDKSNPESETLQREFRDRFRNVSRIMDCVGCDKCRLWGKLQINGMGTALKILFEGSQLKKDRLLQRSELVALVNTVYRISESIRAVESFRKLHEERASIASTDREAEKKSEGDSHTNITKQSKSSPPPSSSSSSSSSSSLSKSRTDDHGQRSASPTKLYKVLVQRAKNAIDRGRSACESQWEKCLSWLMPLLDTSPANRGKAKSEL
jgi:hypothetical protein